MAIHALTATQAFGILARAKLEALVLRGQQLVAILGVMLRPVAAHPPSTKPLASLGFQATSMYLNHNLVLRDLLNHAKLL